MFDEEIEPSEAWLSSYAYMPKVCPWCHKHHGVKATEKQFMDWESGMKVQNAFPDHTAAQRDALLVGICGDCHERIY
jgi:cytochrome c553|tara:strand:- start:320 stop:550 length:231 start_codon:yes stop_codon:yes gene_type:complete